MALLLQVVLQFFLHSINGGLQGDAEIRGMGDVLVAREHGEALGMFERSHGGENADAALQFVGPGGNGRGIRHVHGFAQVGQKAGRFLDKELRGLDQQILVARQPVQGIARIPGDILGLRPRGLDEGGPGQTGQPLDGLKQQVGLQGLGDIIVHARGEAAFAIAAHGVGGRGDDGHMAARLPLVFPDLRRHLEPAQARASARP